jgi:hypothetical protein
MRSPSASRPYPPIVPEEVQKARQTYTIPDHGFQAKRPMRVVGIGAGAAGLVSCDSPEHAVSDT